MNDQQSYDAFVRMVNKFNFYGECRLWALACSANNYPGYGGISLSLDNNPEASWVDEKDEMQFHPWSPTAPKQKFGWPLIK